MLKLTNSQ